MAYGFDRGKRYMADPVTKFALLDKLAVVLKEKPAVVFAYVHGSFLTEATFGDIDVAIFLEKSAIPGDFSLARYEIAVETELDTALGYPSDVRVINRAPLSFRYNVLKYGRLLFTKDEDLSTDFAARTIGDYTDFLPYRKRYLKEVLGLEI